ncbi:MAG: hypothetical protein LUH14_08285 [Clostridiaceae bacterium]|nr:hypothetical protein [Clostridiaceae bacterium]
MRLRYKKFIILFSLAIMLIGMGTFSMIAPSVDFSFGGSSVNSLSTTTSGALASKTDKEIEEDITMLVKNYFDAKQRVAMSELEECVSDISHVEEKRLVTEAEYIEAYKNIDCTILNEGLREGTYRVYVYYETKIYDIDTLVPSLTALYVTADESGKFTIYLSTIDSSDQEAIEALDNSDEIQQKIESVQKKLEDIVSKNADVRDFYNMLESSSSEDETDDTENNENIDQEAGSNQDSD